MFISNEERTALKGVFYETAKKEKIFLYRQNLDSITM